MASSSSFSSVAMATALLLPIILAAASLPPPPNGCGERCGHLSIPFPFHLNSSCGLSLVPAFRLSCPPNSSLPLLSVGPAQLPVLAFLPSARLLLDYSSSSSSPSSSCFRWYSPINASLFDADASPFFGVTAGNVLRLYDCEDSSVCKTACEAAGGGDCESGQTAGCCYPLSDGSAWRPGDGLGAFSQFGCRGFSSWAAARRGIELEWAVPRGFGNWTVCAEGAVAVNATAVAGAVRCSCQPGLVGDGYAGGGGCSKACSNDGYTNGEDCCKGRLCKKRLAILTGVLVSATFLIAAVAIWFLLRQPTNTKSCDLDMACLPKILGRACATRLFTYQELNEATKGFEEDQKLINDVDGTVHTGMLDDGSLVAVQRINCETQHNLTQVLEYVELLSHISHKNINRVIGCCIGSSNKLLLVHEFFSSRTLADLLEQEGGSSSLDWYNRISIATEVASALTYIQCDISPPIYLHDLKSSDIFISMDYSVKIASFKFVNLGPANDQPCSSVASDGLRVVHSFGVILIELLTGLKHGDISTILAKIHNRKFDEIVDPYLEYDEELRDRHEQIERVAFLAARCLSNSTAGSGSCMLGIVQELVRIFSENTSSSSRIRPALEETFSNCSLLQMISMSPDSLHVPRGVGAGRSTLES